MLKKFLGLLLFLLISMVLIYNFSIKEIGIIKNNKLYSSKKDFANEIFSEYETIIFYSKIYFSTFQNRIKLKLNANSKELEIILNRDKNGVFKSEDYKISHLKSLFFEKENKDLIFSFYPKFEFKTDIQLLNKINRYSKKLYKNFSKFMQTRSATNFEQPTLNTHNLTQRYYYKININYGIFNKFFYINRFVKNIFVFDHCYGENTLRIGSDINFDSIKQINFSNFFNKNLEKGFKKSNILSFNCGLLNNIFDENENYITFKKIVNSISQSDSAIYGFYGLGYLSYSSFDNLKLLKNRENLSKLFIQRENLSLLKSESNNYFVIPSNQFFWLKDINNLIKLKNSFDPAAISSINLNKFNFFCKNNEMSLPFYNEVINTLYKDKEIPKNDKLIFYVCSIPNKGFVDKLRVTIFSYNDFISNNNNLYYSKEFMFNWYR